MNVAVPAELGEFVRSQVDSGNYLTPGEVIRAALWTLRECREEDLRREIQKGIDSGPATPLDMARIKANARAAWHAERCRDTSSVLRPKLICSTSGRSS